MLWDKNSEFLFKSILVGDSGVGKSSLLLRLFGNSFEEIYTPTFSLEIKLKIYNEPHKVKIQVWDTSGQDKFSQIRTSFYKGADAVLLIIDLTNFETYNNIEKWNNEITKYSREDVKKVLVGNKTDLITKRIIDLDSAKALADKFGFDYYETSAKVETNIESIFENICSDLKKEIFGIKF